MKYIDLKENQFNVILWCNKLKKDCCIITDDEKKDCHGACGACIESEEI